MDRAFAVLTKASMLSPGGGSETVCMVKGGRCPSGVERYLLAAGTARSFSGKGPSSHFARREQASTESLMSQFEAISCALLHRSGWQNMIVDVIKYANAGAGDRFLFRISIRSQRPSVKVGGFFTTEG